MRSNGTMLGVASILIGAVWFTISFTAVVQQKPLWQGRKARMEWVKPRSPRYLWAAAVHCGVPLVILGVGVRKVYVNRGG